MGSPRFSVLLPTHNRADVLGFAIASVLEQSEPDFELLIVADGCTDSTREVVASFKDRRVHFFDLPKAPYFGYANRNIALRQAKGRFVAYVGHDDLLLPDHLALMGELLDRNGLAWGYSRPLWVSTDGIIVPYCTNLTLADELRFFLVHGNTIPCSCVVHTRAILEEAGFWPEDVPSAADWVLWRRMVSAMGSSVAYLQQPTNLHFSADWKRSRFSGVAEVETLVGIAEGATWWPPILRQPPAAEPEQATIWRAIKCGGPAWVSAVRAATDTVINRIAWTSVRDLQPRIALAIAAQERAEKTAETAIADRARAEKTAEEALAAKERADRIAEGARAAQDRTEKAAARALTCAQQAAEAAQAEAEAVRKSTSWRITAPLRKIVTRVRSAKWAP